MHPDSSPLPGPAALLQAGPRPAALDRLATEEGPALRTWLKRILRRDDQADDAVQEVWVSLLRGGWSFQARSSDPDADARAWLRQVALRIALNTRRRDRAAAKRHEQAALAPAPAPDPLEQVDREDQKAVLAACLELLPGTLRQAVLLRYHHDLDYAAIGAALGCTALTARMRTWRGLQRLRAGLLLLGLLLGSTTTLAAVEGLESHALHDGFPALPAGQGAPSTWLAGSLATAAAVLLVAAAAWWWHASSAPAPGTASPWRLARATTAPLDWFPPLRSATTARIPAEGGELRRILVTTRIIRWQHLPPSRLNRPLVMDAAQWDALVRQHGIEVRAAPALQLLDGIPGSASFTSELPFQAGFHLELGTWIPRTRIARTGLQVQVEVRPDGDGTVIDRVRFDHVDRQWTVVRQEQVPGSTLTWEEPSFHRVGAQAERHRLRPTDRLLVPPSSLQDITVTPGDVITTPASSPTASDVWMVVSAEVVETPQQAVPTPPAGTS